MKHSEGNWKVVDHDISRNLRKIYTDKDILIASTSNINTEANAKLISAAPDLLKAVEATLAFFDDMPKGQFGGIVCDIGLMNQMFLDISSAMKKATK